MEVVIVKRLPRYDPSNSDPIGIKRELSIFGNNVYDQLWFKRGAPSKIHIVSLEIGSDSSSHLKELIFGNSRSRFFDGIHLRGNGASRHFTYRAKNALMPFLVPHSSQFTQKTSTQGQ